VVGACRRMKDSNPATGVPILAFQYDKTALFANRGADFACFSIAPEAPEKIARTSDLQLFAMPSLTIASHFSATTVPVGYAGLRDGIQ
jgi:hypothetical protein